MDRGSTRSFSKGNLLVMKFNKENLILILLVGIFVSGLLIFFWNLMSGKDLRQPPEINFEPITSIWQQAEEVSSVPNEAMVLYVTDFFEQADELATKQFLMKILNKYCVIEENDIEFIQNENYIAQIRVDGNLDISLLEQEYGDVVKMQNEK